MLNIITRGRCSPRICEEQCRKIRGVFERGRGIGSFIFRQFRDKWSFGLTGHYNDISKVSTGQLTEEASSRFRSRLHSFFQASMASSFVAIPQTGGRGTHAPKKYFGLIETPRATRKPEFLRDSNFKLNDEKKKRSNRIIFHVSYYSFFNKLTIDSVPSSSHLENEKIKNHLHPSTASYLSTTPPISLNIEKRKSIANSLSADSSTNCPSRFSMRKEPINSGSRFRSPINRWIEGEEREGGGNPISSGFFVAAARLLDSGIGRN